MSGGLLRACLVVAVAAAAAPGAWAVEVYGINGPPELGDDYYLGLVKGQVRLVKDLDRVEWKFERTGRGVLIRADVGKGLKYHGWYLSYDPAGKDKGLFLSKEPTAGSYWAVVKNTAEGGQPYVHSFHAKAGRLSLWTLSVGDKAERLKGRRGRPYTAYKVVLKRDPRPVPRFYLIEVAP
jgi:hypothetical protein